ncbi:MAG TPA: hypothetical protein VE174_04985, partial [Actinomycetota bacterium]|nr:hypothetical protein [Actinomycetota bacterium]
MRGAPERGEKVRGAELFERFAGRVDDERGVTLGELLISILVIAILAAVSQGVYLHQRRKGWSSQVISATKNLASLQEYWVNTEGRIGYTTDLNFLVESGYTYSSDDVVPVIAAAGTGSFCLEVASAHDPSIVWHYDSADGRPAEGPVDPACVAGITVASTDSGTGGALDTPAGSAGDESDPVGGGDSTSSADDGDVGDEGDESGDSAGGDANDTSGNGASGGNDGNDDSGNGSGGSAGSGSGGDQNGGDGNGGGGNGGGGNGGGGNGGGGNGGGG